MLLKNTISKLWGRWLLAAFGALAASLAVQTASAAPCDLKNNPPAFIRHDLGVSYCELCGYGYVTVIISNPYEGVDMINMTVVENLRNSGLTYDPGAPNPVRYSVNGGPLQAGGAPIISGTNDSILTWTASRIPPLNNLAYRTGWGFNTIAITFAVTRDNNVSQEGLVGADRRIQAQLTYSTGNQCFAGSTTVSTGLDTLPLYEPSPAVSKRGRNADAAQGSNEYSQTVYGNVNDDVIWRIQVRNNGLADLQDLRFDDQMPTGNMEIRYACPTEAAATAITNANGIGPGSQGCVDIRALNNTINNYDVDNPFGNPGNDWPDLVDVRQGQSAYIYLVGKIPNSPNGSCSVNRTNTVSDIQWGCQAESPPVGGISSTSTGYTPGNASATLSSQSVNSGNNLNIQTEIIGTNTAQPAGSKGTVRITIRNYTGGTVKGIKLRDVLPPEYVVDPTFTPAVTATGAYGAYAGMTDRIQWTNPAPGTFPLTTTNPAVALSNTAPEFTLYSSTAHPIYADQFDMLRHGDRLVITFRIILIRPQSYDKVADLDVRTEAPNSDPPGTDPDNARQLTNRLYVDFQDFCQPGVIKHPPTNPLVTTHQSNPEDLDINIAGSELVFILTGDPSQRLPLTVNLRNNGGHDAADYSAYVTFGATMDVVTVPAGCSLTSNPPALDVWHQPAFIPSDAAVYQCTGAPVAPGQTVAYNFEVVKSTDPADLAADDLTFRADVVGEITLSNGTPLWFPTPVNPRADGGTDRADNYSLDGLRARVVGFNLLKSQVGTCSENNPPPNSPDREVQIGEECSFHIDTGGWFGFQTPGFTYIAVQDISVFDQLPDGQGYISSTDPYVASTGAIQGVSLNPAGLAPTDEVSAPDYMNWTFNQVVPGERIMEKDHWFRVDMTSRLLNDPIDTSAAPNQHAAASTNILNSYFQAVFYNDVTNMEEIYDLGPGTVGYPRLEVRRVELTVTEPHLTVVKEVCNESLYGTGTGCTNFVPLADDGDAYNSYIYRLTITNEADSGGVDRAPAYDVIVTDALDASDLAYVLPFAGDGLDNDGDGLIDAADTDGEAGINDNTVRNSTPAVITFSYTNSTGLLRINAGQSVQLFYRVDYDDDAAPLQTFTNTAEAAYDSLEGVSGNQSAPQGLNSEKAGARVYTSQPDSAAVRIIPVETQPKRIAAVSNSPLASGPATQEVTIGEEIEYRFNTLLPVALLRNFVIRDELPAGLTCSEAPAVNLDAPPYSAANFVPGGTITPTCSGGLVEWNFGNQRVTTGTAGLGNRYDFEIGFIARVENTAGTNDADVISNGHPATVATARYVDEASNAVVLNFGQVDVLVREPRIVLTKTFAVANADAGDVLTVTVTATNTGTATAYNLRVLDDLVGRDLTYAGNPGGTHPPDNVDTATLGANRPIFSWNPPNGIAVGDTISFTFDVRADTAVQPLEVLDNTIQADWTSLPGQTTALNSTGTIGANGSTTGMRIGALPNAGDTINDYEATAGHQVSVPPLTLDKTDLDTAMIPAIGVHKSFQIDIRLPEGTTRGLTVTDSLNASGVSYLLANNATYDIAYTFQGIATINGLAPGEAAFNAFPADNTSGSAVWDIGTVVTQTENDPTQNAIAPLIRIQYYARVNNDTDTDSGDPLSNSAVVNYTHGETGSQETLTDTTAAVIVVEPVLTMTKTVSNITSPGNPAGGGDILEYVVTIANSGTATAHDVNVVDTLPAELALYTGFTPTALINGAVVGGFVATPANAPDGPLVWGHGNGDDSLDIPVGQSLVLTYRVVVEEATGTLSNSVYADWTSLNGDSTFERNGAGCPSWTAPNDYCTGPAVASTGTVDDNAIVKEISADTYDVPPLSTAVDAIARVGDTITYRLALELRGGLTRNVQVQDTLPTGMAFLDIVRINGDTTASYTPPGSGAGSNFTYAPITAGNVPSTGQTGTLTWTIGDIVNDPYGDPTTDTLEIVYRATIEPDAGIAHVAATTLTNTAVLSYTDAPSLNDTATVSLRQPVINQITKTDRLGRTSPLAVTVASDIMQFRLEACNSGQAPAYSVQVSDQLATQLDEASVSAPVVSVGGTVLTAGSDYTYTPPAARGGTMTFVLNTPINPGQCLTIDYDVAFYDDFGENQVWHNSATVDEYWSLPAQSGQQYGPVGPATFTMHNVSTNGPPIKTIVSPASGEATIGQEIVYQIIVPEDPVAKNAAMDNVVVIDALNENLEFLSATEVSGNGFTLVVSSVPPNQVNVSVVHIPAGQQAIIELRARVRNIAGAQGGVTFTNTALYTFEDPAAPGITQGGGTGTTAPIRIIEPELALGKSVVNTTNPGNPPQAGDILRYTLAFTASGGGAGDNFSDAFDLRIDDTLSLGLVYNGNPTVNGSGNTIGAPVVTGDGVTTPQTLVWHLAAGNADIDIAEGSVVNVSYDVLVLDSVLANQTLSNSATAQWTGIDGPDANERTGTGSPAWNDYFTGPVTAVLTTQDATTIAKTRLQDTYNTADANVRIGDIVTYELRVGMQEGTLSNVVLTDSLPQGLVFEGIAAINGDTSAPFAAVAPFAHADITGASVVTTGDPATGPTTITWNLGDIVDQADGNSTNDDFVIIYRARVLNDAHAHVNTINLTNTVSMAYDTATGPAVPRTDDETITVLQPNLTVAKSAAAAGGDTVLGAGELVTYTVDIVNNGSAPAYDTLLTDIIPVGLRNGAATITMVSTQLLSGTVLPNLAPVYDAATGVATWDFDTGTADQYTIPAGDTLRIVYQVQADTTIGAGLTLTNQAQVQLYYSFDDESVPAAGGVTGVRQVYGPSNIASTTLTTDTPVALSKQNPAVLTAAIGEPFTYRITVPATPQAVALNDVRILDDLNASAADLTFVSVVKVSGSQPWTPVNTGSATNLVIEDTTIGIDIPAGEQIAVDITVVLEDTGTNVSGLQFNNTATYTFNQVDDDPATQTDGGPDTTPDMTIVGSEALTLQIDPDPVTMQVGTPATFTLVVHNPGTGTAWNPTITDRLPNETNGGLCAAGPSNVTAQIFADAAGTTPVSPVLAQGTDYTVTFNGEPGCEWTLSLLSPAGGIGADQYLIIHYDVELDADTANGIALNNYAWVSQWFSTDPNVAGSTPHTYSHVLTEATPGTPGTDDEEDSQTINTQAPVLEFRKHVQNLTTGQDPGNNASPGDTLHYTLTITNNGPVGLSSFSIVDELDRLNAVPAFAPGSLNLISVPAGADVTATNPAGGTHGTGLVDIANLAIGAAGDSLQVEFEVTLAPVITSGTVVLNQAGLVFDGEELLLSDSDPSLTSAADPTETLIASAPLFQVQKTATSLEGDPGIVMAGETLRYTLTIKNVGSENAVNVILHDYTPANTVYVANSTTLNGAAVPDAGPGVNPLHDGILINAPEDTTPGNMRADADAAATNVATVTFDVAVDPGAMDGLVICNQGFVNGNGLGSGPQPEQPSDDPATPTPDDPTCIIVGNLPLLYAQKTVQIQQDLGSPGIVDPGDVLRYTITVNNFGAIPATGVVFTDAVPAHTTYVADSTVLNGVSLGPDGGISPLVAGHSIQSSDNPGDGIVSAGQSAVITFDVRVDDDVPPGTVPAGTEISNQGSITSNELSPEPTDADGVPSNGDQPTIVVVGDVQRLSITKEVAVVGGGAATAGGQLTYIIRVTNIGSLPATRVVVTDDLNPPLGDQVTYVAGSGTLDGSAAGVSFAGSVLSADYTAQYGDLQPGDTTVLSFRVQIAAGLTAGTTITNTGVVHWNNPEETASADASIDVGGTPGSAELNGTVWHDANLDKICDDSSETCLEGWSVELYRSGLLITTVLTEADGSYRIAGLVPTQGTGDLYELRFRAPGAGPNTASLGNGDSTHTNGPSFTDGPQRISIITLASGSNLQNMNLPLWPNGAVYNSVERGPIAGTRLALLNAATGAALPTQCFDDPQQQNQVTAQDGFYKFDLNFSDAACPAGGAYLIEVNPPATGYASMPSRIIPPTSDAATAPFSIPTCPGSAIDALPATVDYCEATASAAIPPVSVPPRTAGTVHYLHLLLGNGNVPGHSQVFNNPIPVDPDLGDTVAITKTSSLINVTRGELVPYTITVTNVFSAPLYDMSIVDRFPAGFKYVAGSARMDGTASEPQINGRELTWPGLTLEVNQKYTLRLLLVVGSGVSEGEYVNRAQVLNPAMGTAVSGEATATVRVVPDPDFDCTDVIGKVFDDRNLDGWQDADEKGLGGVRVVTARGLIATSDKQGRFHITCAAVPDEDRGSNFILKLDERSLPTGYRMTTENPRVQRATRGKMLRFNFGATIHRVVRLDIADGVFEPDTSEVRLQWTPRLAKLLEELRKAPSVLRLAYLADVEREGLVDKRLAALKKEITDQWDRSDNAYRLTVETEIFWRRGAPVAGR